VAGGYASTPLNLVEAPFDQIARPKALKQIASLPFRFGGILAHAPCCLTSALIQSASTTSTATPWAVDGPSRQMPMLWLYGGLQAIPDIERFSARTESLANAE